MQHRHLVPRLPQTPHNSIRHHSLHISPKRHPCHDFRLVHCYAPSLESRWRNFLKFISSHYLVEFFFDSSFVSTNPLPNCVSFLFRKASFPIRRLRQVARVKFKPSAKFCSAGMNMHRVMVIRIHGNTGAVRETAQFPQELSRLEYASDEKRSRGLGASSAAVL